MSLTRVEIRASEIAKRIAELADTDLTDDTRQELVGLRNEYQDVQEKRIALLEVEERSKADAITPDGVMNAVKVERRSLADRSSISEVVNAVVENRATTGATAELQKELGLTSAQVPLELFTEYRAVTPAPTNVPVNHGETVMPVFNTGDTAYLNIPMPVVPAGAHAWPVMTTRPTVGAPNEHASQSETTGSFTVVEITPRRLQASFFYSREARARFSTIETSLRSALSTGLSEGLDQRVINTLHGSTLSGVNAGSGLSDWGEINSAIHARIDGRFAKGLADLKLLMGADTFAYFGTQFRGNNTDESLAERLSRQGIAQRVSDLMPAVASKKQDVIIRRGSRMDAVAPIWEGVNIIYDEVTRAATGQIQLTAVMLANWEVLRTDGFTKLTPQIQA